MFNLSKLFLVSFFTFIWSATLFASLPEHFISVSPAVNTVDVVKDSRVITSFDKPIIKHSNIDIANHKDKINGDTFIVNDTFLEFAPSVSLGDGLHQVSINPVILESKPVTYEPNGFFQRAAYRICKIFYNKKINQCPLIKYVDTKKHHIETEAFSYHFSTLPPGPTIRSLKLSISKDELAIGDSATLVLEALMDDNETKVIDSDIEWVMNKPALVSINGLTLSTLDEGEVTLQANHKNTLSNALHVNIYKEINGYKLPPEPDPKINNSTILGIDSNGNGIRDDMEIYIIKKYANDPKFPKTKTAIELQAAWASQRILETPTIESDEYLAESIACWGYWIDKQTVGMGGFEAGKYGSSLLKLYSPEFEDKMYNTRERIEQDFVFREALSGKILKGSQKKGVDNCIFNIDELGE